MSTQNNPKAVVTNPKQVQSFVVWGLVLFLIAALLGTSMRLFWVVELPYFEYTNVLHAHSHLAMLGWGFTIICALFIHFLKGYIQKPKLYWGLVLANILVCSLMTVSFVLKGYTILSISLLTAHLLIAYYLGFLLLSDLKKLRNQTATLLGRWAIYWMFISTIGVWFLPLVIVNLGKLHPLYLASIEFFLHLQFNGWFVFAVLSILVLFFELQGKILKISRLEFFGLQISLVLTYGLPAYWSYPFEILAYLNSLGVLIQAVVFGRLLIPMVKALKDPTQDKSDLGYWLIVLGLISLFAKIVVQLTLLLPAFLHASSDIRQFFVGFIHLIMLGFFTMTSVGICLRRGLIPQNMLSKVGLLMLIIAFILTELTLFSQGLLLWNSFDSIPKYYEILLGFTLFLPLGILLVLASFAVKQPKGLLH
ncbi:hypothetical protein [Algoriphagus chordae]|uniref:Uncharacterized protein n=1 Tax=Algoriphagus chordae TaxID=237019 RepID=A0A2W7RC78_9BACT|nr:hypothetical protein [Algoriphagus chordae]PZX48325.1 hypothetical protein LV85_03736 [Algoriphagus chordae]